MGWSNTLFWARAVLINWHIRSPPPPDEPGTMHSGEDGGAASNEVANREQAIEQILRRKNVMAVACYCFWYDLAVAHRAGCRQCTTARTKS
ncbi:hypothetical protein D3C77_713250 [compost metagenome]